jgi:hypothetical protein
VIEIYQLTPRPPYQKNPPTRDPKYLAWIRTQPCAVQNCRACFVEAAHTGDRGLTQKASDREAIPLCHFHHRSAPTAYHKGRRAFERAYNLDIPALIQELNQWYEVERSTAV